MDLLWKSLDDQNQDPLLQMLHLNLLLWLLYHNINYCSPFVIRLIINISTKAISYTMCDHCSASCREYRYSSTYGNSRSYNPSCCSSGNTCSAARDRWTLFACSSPCCWNAVAPRRCPTPPRPLAWRIWTPLDATLVGVATIALEEQFHLFAAAQLALVSGVSSHLRS